MKVFHCDQVVFYENVACINCGHTLAYLPELGEMTAMQRLDDGRLRSLAAGDQSATYKLCANSLHHGVCNWALAADDPNELCRACRLTRVVPNLEVAGHLETWRKLELAKRRLVFSLLDLRLTVRDRLQDPEAGLAFDFLADDPAGGAGGPVLTGHDNGVITINVAEADDAEREKRRLQMHEPYRTLLGHFRHEIGHYYWDRLIRDGQRTEAFRALFGDESQDYGEALQSHYDQGPPADWQQRFVSTYASSHPWEDWAETWAHYLHIVDALQTAGACGVSIEPNRPHEPAMRKPDPDARDVTFERLIESWASLTYALNNLNRSLGQGDSYPFVLTTCVLDKLRFIHELVVPIAMQVAPDPETEAESACDAVVVMAIPTQQQQPADGGAAAITETPVETPAAIPDPATMVMAQLQQEPG